MEWDKTFGGNNNDRAYSLIQTNDGGYAVAGTTESKGTDKEDFWVIKFSEKKADPILPLLFALILPALFIIYYLFVLPIKKRKRKVRREENKETIEVFSHHQKEDSQEEIREQLSDEPIPYDPIIREYREIQDTMLKVNPQTLLLTLYFIVNILKNLDSNILCLVSIHSMSY